LRVADAAEALISGHMKYEQFLSLAPEETDDEDIGHLLDLIEHVPKLGGLGGVKPAAYESHMQAVREAVRILRGRA